jgi:hypothetical protein
VKTRASSVVIAILASAAILTVSTSRVSAEDTSMANQALPPFTGAVEWLNSRPLTDAELRGKVVLVEFWTYT